MVLLTRGRVCQEAVQNRPNVEKLCKKAKIASAWAIREQITHKYEQLLLLRE